MRVKSFLSVCLASAMALMAASRAQAAGNSITLQFSGVVNPISSDYIGLFSSQPGSETFEGYAPLQNVPAGDSSQSFIISPTGASQTLPGDIQANTPIDSVLLIGVYTAAVSPTISVVQTQGITVGVSPIAAFVLGGQSYSTLASFSPSIPSESTLVSDLQNPSTSDISLVLSTVATPIGSIASEALIGVGGSGSLVSFSNGTGNGSVDVSSGPTQGGGNPVPLPASAWMALTTLAGIAVVSTLRSRKASIGA